MKGEVIPIFIYEAFRGSFFAKNRSAIAYKGSVVMQGGSLQELVT